MKPRRVYIDTSVVGGCFDAEFEEASLRLFELFHTGDLIAVVSRLVLSEVQGAPPTVRAMLARIPSAHREDVRVTREAVGLAKRYVAAGVLGRAMQADAHHIATATVHRVDVLASWNFKHIVNVRRIHGYNDVNLREGHSSVEIPTPAEVVRYGRRKDR
jgi:predicted nucleic acid-binding protein